MSRTFLTSPVGDRNWQHRIGPNLTLILRQTLLLNLPLPLSQSLSTAADADAAGQVVTDIVSLKGEIQRQR